MDSLDSTKPYSMWRNTTNIWLMRQVFVKFVHSKPRFIDCFPPAYHNSFSVGLKRCLSCYKYHFDGYRISSWQRKWFSLHSSYENGLLLALYLFYNIEEGLGLVFVVTMTGAINRCGWLICLILTTWTGKVFMFAFT